VWHVLVFERFQKVMQAPGPTSQKIDPLKIADAEQLFEDLKAKRNDEALVAYLFPNVSGDADFFLDPNFVERGVAAAQEHFHRLVLQGASDLPAPTIAGFKSEDICEDRVPCGLKTRSKPEYKFIIFGRGFTYEHDLPRSTVGICTHVDVSSRIAQA
jgi:hypothetical protein